MEKSNQYIDFAVLEFYDKVRELLSDAGRYAQVFKLRENLNDSATRFKVEHVFLRYYDGNPRKLNDAVRFQRNQCFRVITEINRLCERAGIIPVDKKEALTELLLDEVRRKGWAKLVKKYQKNNQIVPLQAIELEFRKNRANEAT